MVMWGVFGGLPNATALANTLQGDPLHFEPNILSARVLPRPRPVSTLRVTSTPIRSGQSQKQQTSGAPDFSIRQDEVTSDPELQ